MAKPNTLQAGRDFLADVMARAGVTPGSNPAIDALLQNEQALVAAGEGALGRSELSRQHDSLRQETDALQAEKDRVADIAEQQRTWWETHKDDVTLASQVRSGQAPTVPAARPASPVMPTAETLTRAQAEELATSAVTNALKTFGADVITLGTQLTGLSGKHFVEFGGALDTDALVKLAEAKKLPLPMAYDLMVGEARATKQQAAVDLQIKTAREEGERIGREAVMTAMGQQTPYPVGQVTPGPVMAGLEATRVANEGKPADQRTHSSQNPDYNLGAALKTFHEETARLAQR